MPATKDSTHTKQKRKPKPAPAADAEVNGSEPAADTPAATPATASRPPRRDAAPPAVKGKVAATRIRELADRCETLQTRRHLR